METASTSSPEVHAKIREDILHFDLFSSIPVLDEPAVVVESPPSTARSGAGYRESGSGLISPRQVRFLGDTNSFSAAAASPPAAAAPKELPPTNCVQCALKFDGTLMPITLHCRHHMCLACVGQVCANGSLLCPQCRQRTFFEKRQEEAGSGGGMMVRRRSGTFCLQCGTSFLSTKVTHVTLHCRHEVCSGCVEELTVNGALTCPTCHTRSFFERRRAGGEGGGDGNEEEEDERAVLVRLKTGTYCMQCGVSYLKSKVNQVRLHCRHEICELCVRELLVDEALMCPICHRRSFLEKTAIDDEDKEHFVRLQTGTYCIQCGVSYMKSRSNPVKLHCRHQLCSSCVDQLCCDGALSCPVCNKRTFFERQQNDDDEEEKAVLVRLKTGTFCPQCGVSYMKSKSPPVVLQCRHELCGSCVDELCCDGALSCPLCHKRSFFEVQLDKNLQQQVEEEEEEAEAVARLVRLKTGTFCPQCGVSYLKSKVSQVKLHCKHELCQNCVDERCCNGALSCPVCHKRSFFERCDDVDDDEEMVGRLVRMQTGTFCPHCGVSYMKSKRRNVALACSHELCEVCVDELCCDRCVLCPLCRKRTRFQPVMKPHEEQLAALVRSMTGKFCPGCGKNLFGNNVVVNILSSCGHSVCAGCLDRIQRSGGGGVTMKCPLCQRVSVADTHKPTEPSSTSSSMSPPQAKLKPLPNPSPATATRHYF